MIVIFRLFLIHFPWLICENYLLPEKKKIHFPSFPPLFISPSLPAPVSQFCVGVLIAGPAHHIWALFESTLLFRQLGSKTNRIPSVYASQSPYVNASAHTRRPSLSSRRSHAHTHNDSQCLCLSSIFHGQLGEMESMSR